MKIYEVTTVNLMTNGELGDEYQSYLGFDFDSALTAKSKALDDYDRLSDYDKKRCIVECRVYNVPDDVNVNDEDDITEAICECIGYDEF